MDKNEIIALFKADISLEEIAKDKNIPLLTICNLYMDYVKKYHVKTLNNPNYLYASSKLLIKKKNYKYIDPYCHFKIDGETDYVMTRIKSNVIYYYLQGMSCLALSKETGLSLESIEELCSNYVKKENVIVSSSLKDELTDYEEYVLLLKKGHSHKDAFMMMGISRNVADRYREKYLNSIHNFNVPKKEKAKPNLLAGDHVVIEYNDNDEQQILKFALGCESQDSSYETLDMDSPFAKQIFTKKVGERFIFDFNGLKANCKILAVNSYADMRKKDKEEKRSEKMLKLNEVEKNIIYMIFGGKNPEDIAVNLNVPVSKVYTTLKTYILSHKEVSFKEFSTEIQKNIGVSSRRK